MEGENSPHGMLGSTRPHVHHDVCVESGATDDVLGNRRGAEAKNKTKTLLHDKIRYIY